MTTPTGQISMSDVRLEIYGSATGQIHLQDPNVYTLAGVTSGNPISMSQLKGKTWSGGSSVAITNQTLSATRASGTATCEYLLNSNGNVYQVINGTQTLIETWLKSGVSSSFQVEAVLSSGTSTTGSSLSTWLALSSSQGWTLSQGPALGSDTATLTVSIRDASTLSVLSTATITLDASVG